jgi:2-polyprenyl-6-methoxyphenol hydroxylase-like FAD-dependent oxidoreductase
MTLATVSPYDSSAVSKRTDRAIVLGASMAGLCAARVLTDGFEDVIVIERDPLPDEPIVRRSVPQASQPHILWEAGRSTLEDLFPGYSDELLAAGGVLIDGRNDFHNYSRGAFLARGRDDFPLYSATRLLYEHLVRRRVSKLNDVAIRDNCQFIDYLVDDTSTTIEGVSIRTRDGKREELPAELVVDATGRTSRTPVWLEKHGYRPPTLDELCIDVAYSTTFVERPAGDHRTIGILAEAPRTRGGLAAPVEGGRWLMNLHGVHGDHPPTDTEGFVDFAASLPTPEIKQLVDEYPLVDGDISHYPFSANRRYRYEDLDQFPKGLLVIGDAIASFNPIYGQGMSVAALESLELHHTLVKGGRKGITPRFFNRAGTIVDTAWMMATGADFSYPETEGTKPRGATFFNWYLARLFRNAHTDGRLTDAFNRVLSMQQPPTSLLRPTVLWRVLKPLRG